MPAFVKLNTGNDIINGLAAVMTGGGPTTYDGTNITDHVVVTDSGNQRLDNIDGRFLVGPDLRYRVLPSSSGDRAEATHADAVVTLAAQPNRRHSLTEV